MLETARARKFMVTAPHRLAADAGLDVLKAGGTAVEAAVAAAATIAVVYPHMNGLGGDGFWLIAEPGKDPIAIDACGRAGQNVTRELYTTRGLSEIPTRGPLAANTVAGAVSGWELALELTRNWQQPMPLGALLARAIDHAENGTPLPLNFAQLLTARRTELQDQPGFSDLFIPGGEIPRAGSLLKLPALALTLKTLARDGLDSFYNGGLAETLAADLRAAGSPLTLADLRAHRALQVTPLHVDLGPARVWNLPPPTQGLASLIILGLFERLGVTEADGFAHIHALVEATKQAFLIRDAVVSDPGDLTEDPMDHLSPAAIRAMAARIDPRRALPWPQPPRGADTAWLGVVDREGRSVSYIQSLYFEFGSGVVLPRTGIVWQNRGSFFRLEPTARNRLAPGRKTLHTLNPAFARFRDGREMTYGTMGGEGQPQTQAAVFTRYAYFGTELQRAITEPRWLLGRTWGEDSVTLKLERGFTQETVAALEAAGHDVQIIPAWSGTMGHAGAIVRHPDGTLEGASDPRSDGAATGW